VLERVLTSARDIPDQVLLDLVETQARERDGLGAVLWELQAALPDYPPKVIKAKLRKLSRRGLITGCLCGCRGDFALTERAVIDVRKSPMGGTVAGTELTLGPTGKPFDWCGE
jgi:hypothetical protein